MPQLRQNIITGDWVVIAPERAKRPSDFVTRAATRVQEKETCPFCAPEGENYKARLGGEYESDHIYVTPNKYPAFLENEVHFSSRSHLVEDDFYRLRPSLGGHDVVIVKDHDLDLPQFTRPVWMELLTQFQKRYHYFARERRVGYAMPIYNHRPEAGASIEHPHAQIFASDIIPNLITKELHHTENYYEHHGSCAFCDIVSHEKKYGIRVIAENSDFIAFTFYAARFPFEIWILPKRHQARFEDISAAEIDSLSAICYAVFHKLDKTLNDPPLNFFIHSIPNTIDDVVYYHWHLEIGPRVSKYGGYELGSGVVIDVVSPEKAAMYLKGLEND